MTLLATELSGISSLVLLESWFSTLLGLSLVIIAAVAVAGFRRQEKIRRTLLVVGAAWGILAWSICGVGALLPIYYTVVLSK